MRLKLSLLAILLTAGVLIGCGTSSAGPGGSKSQTTSGVSSSGYPAGQPKDATSPSLGSSSEQKYARTEGEAEKSEKSEKKD